MKNRILGIFLSTILLITISCKNINFFDKMSFSFSDNAFVIDEDGFKNNNITINAGNPSADLTGTYYAIQDITHIVINGKYKKDDVSLIIDIKGKDVKAYKLCKYQNSMQINIGNREYLCKSGDVVFTSYGAEDNSISGTFSGIFIRDVNAVITTSVKISKGKFKVVRLKDNTEDKIVN